MWLARAATLAAQVAKAPPDGHTILINVNNFAINPVFYDKVPYDPFKDFEAITLAVTNDVAFVINPSVPARTVAELVALIKAGTGKYTFASGGTGSVTHLLGEQFKQSLGLDLVHVPYNGGGPSIAAVVAGHTQMASLPDLKVRFAELGFVPVGSSAEEFTSQIR